MHSVSFLFLLSYFLAFSVRFYLRIVVCQTNKLKISFTHAPLKRSCHLSGFTNLLKFIVIIIPESRYTRSLVRLTTIRLLLFIHEFMHLRNIFFSYLWKWFFQTTLVFRFRFRTSSSSSHKSRANLPLVFRLFIFFFYLFVYLLLLLDDYHFEKKIKINK